MSSYEMYSIRIPLPAIIYDPVGWICDYFAPRISRYATCPSLDLEFVVEPMLADDFSFVESLLRGPHDDRCMAMSVIVNVDRVFAESHSIEGVDYGDLGGRESEGGILSVCAGGIICFFVIVAVS
ncbi:uncharacterized protein BDW43DRAFT_101980 [Aspergillus alliaceus]|uniref:uncharacterized protein n=1 Tax=Petromyces alliaceus TaxID=209559 RepID=UPI0012A47C8E|nr:uncharacterized protein BDW43DRAFT_101980 [Aspergillus alliaceus]KAB8232708.1 hypothetical protein BDW43DRAFT_101980 [Aspergillus alliaceus]